MTKEIFLTQGKVALVDDEDYEWLNQVKWYTKKSERNWYAICNKYSGMIWLHRLIMNPPDNMQIDHINGDGLDNRRCNLRIVTKSQNMMNMKKRSLTSSKYKGVYWHKKANKWVGYISLNYEVKYLGLFINEEDAARIHDVAAKKYHGEYARLNFPEEK